MFIGDVFRAPRCAAVLAVLSLVISLAACSGDGGETSVADAGEPGVADVGVGADIGEEPGDDISVVEDSAEDVPQPYENGAVAFVAAEDELIGGPIAAGVAGDVVLQNSHVRFVVRNQERSLFSPYGGALVDADVVRGDGEPGRDHFFEIFPMIGFGGAFRAESMEIVDDGVLSGTAVVRFTGSDGGMTLVDSLIPTVRTGLEVTLDYVLTPDAKHVEIVTTAHNPAELARVAVLGVLAQFGHRLRKFYDGCGADQECLMTQAGTRWLAASVADVSYALSLPSPEALSLMLAEEELLLLSAGNFRIEPGEEVTLRQYLAVGSGSVDEVVQTVAALRGDDMGVEVPVEITMGDELSDPRDAFLSARAAGELEGAWIDAATPDAEGNAVLHLLPGSYDLVLEVPGAPDTVLTDVAVGDASHEPIPFVANAAGHLRVQITDGDGEPVTGALVLQAGLDAGWLAGRSLFEAIHNGDRTIPVLPGDYTATLSHGLAWTIDRQNVSVTAGGLSELSGSIAPAFSTEGGLMMNSHEHCELSIDSSVTVQDRVWNAVANGIDLMNPTDHDHFGTHEGTIAELGLEDVVHSFLGCEVSPLWGHTTATGCLSPPAYDTYYAVDFTIYDETGTAVRGMTATEIYEQARDVLECEFLAVNHPYRGQATFDTYDVTATSDPADALPDLNLSLVDALEIYNKTDGLDVILDQNLPAWFNLLNRGYAIAGIGGSDEHGYNGNYGNPRNWIPLSGTVADGIDQTEVFDAIKSHRSFVLGGPFLRIDVDGAGMGDTVTAAAGVVTVHLEALAPEWMGLGFARLYANGEVVREFVPLAEGDVLRLDETFELTLENDAHLVFVAGSLQGEHDMNPVSGKNPLSVTNPVFVDADGGGYLPIWSDMQ